MFQFFVELVYEGEELLSIFLLTDLVAEFFDMFGERHFATPEIAKLSRRRAICTLYFREGHKEH